MMCLGMCRCMRIRCLRTFCSSYGKVCAGLTEQNALERMGRLFWFTVEFGVIRQAGEIKVYGSGLISSHGECTHVVNRRAAAGDSGLRSGRGAGDGGGCGEMQPVLYAIESFEQIYEAAKEAESRLG